MASCPSPNSNPNPNQERFSRASGWRPACGRQWRASPTSAHSMARWPLVPPLAAASQRSQAPRRYGYQGLGPVGTSATATLLVAPRGMTASVTTVGPTPTPPPNPKPNPNPSPIPNPSFSPCTNPKPNPSPYPKLNPSPNLNQVGPTRHLMIVRWARIVKTAARASLLTFASLTRSRNA